jgi:signal transduction histidine kinase
MTTPSEKFLLLLAHELRSPIAAIMGFQDLMKEGLLGHIDPPAGDALDRMRTSAQQLMTLIASLGEAATDDIRNLHVDIEPVDIRSLVDETLRDMAVEAEGRGSRLVADTPPSTETDSFLTDAERARRALILLLNAALRSASQTELHIATTVDSDQFTCTITGTRLPADTPDINTILDAATAAQLRIAMARQTIRPLHGDVQLTDDAGSTTITLHIPASRPTT